MHTRPAPCSTSPILSPVPSGFRRTTWALAGLLAAIPACGDDSGDDGPLDGMNDDAADDDDDDDGDDDDDDDMMLPEPVGTLHVLLLGFGPAWDEEADLAQLADHEAEIEARFAAGQLLANALRADGLGMYLYDASAVDPEALLTSDPAVADERLVVAGEDTWTLLLENMGAPLTETDATFVLDYAYGPAADDSLPFVGQDIAEHSAYFGGLFEEGRVLAGGVVGDEHARYVVVSPDLESAQEVAAADPAVMSGTFEVTTTQWGNPPPLPPFFHRRSLPDTQAAQP